MYVPIMKNRKEELIVIKNMNGYFNDSMIPLIELIKDEHEKNMKLMRTLESLYMSKKLAKQEEIELEYHPLKQT